MPKLNLHRRDHMKTVVNDFTADELQRRLGPNFAKPEKKQPRTPYLTPKAVERRWQMLDNEEAKAQLLDGHTQEQMLCYNKNIENFIGTVKMPIGIAGPLRVNGLFAQNDFHVPLATTEAALVASYNRGSQLITQAGGASAMLLNEGVTRTPCFAFYDLAQAGQFVAWVVTQYDEFRRIAESTTRHGKLADISVNIEGNHVYLVFEYLTGDASGQNMVTISTNAVFEHILHHSPIKPLEAFLDGNLSGDKKATAQTLRGVRGKKVTAEINIEQALVEKMLHTTSQKMAEFARMNTIGGTLSGSIGINAHYANALAAFYIACGQDAACVAESAVGITRIEVNQHGGLYASVTLPNLMVGTVGGGTSLPSQKACLDLLGLHGNGNSQALSEVCAALCLAGELSIVGAFCAGHFSRAHHKLAR